MLGLGGTNYLQLYGTWAPFTDQNAGSNFYNQQAYYDSNGTEWAIGTGPAPLLGGGSSLANFIASPGNPVNLTQSGTAPALTDSSQLVASVNPVSDFFASSGFSSFFTLLTSSVIGGIPNYVFLIGAAGLFFLTENKGKS